MALLLHSTAERQTIWARVFAEAGETLIPDLDSVTDPAAVTDLACWLPPGDLSRFPNLRTVICVGAGTDHFPALPAGVSLTRTIAPGIEAMVRDWALMATLMLHREMPVYLDQAARGDWTSRTSRAASTRRVGVMGMGRIGRLVAASLSSLGFQVAGYSRSGSPVPGVDVYGADRLPAFLARTDLLICLLPLTAETRGMMSDDFFSALPEGASVVHAGRGAQMDLAALRRALESGRIRSAMLDVTDPEPLPQDHWAWTDPRVLVTPHVGSHTDAVEGAEHALAVVRASRAGQPLPGFVDPASGY